MVHIMKSLAASVLDSFKARDQKKLRKINDTIMREATINFTKQMYELAVLSYILSKIVSKPRFLSKDNIQYLRKIEQDLRMLLRAIDIGITNEVFSALSAVKASISALEKVDSRFVRNLVSKGQLKTAAIMYAQGISLGLASEMTGISKQDILDYAGKTMMFDRIKEEIPVKDRLKTARRALA